MPFGLVDGLASNHNREFGVKLFGTGRDTKRLYEQNKVLAIDTRVLF